MMQHYVLVAAASDATPLADALKAQGVVERVERSDACILLLTKSVLLQPACLRCPLSGAYQPPPPGQQQS